MAIYKEDIADINLETGNIHRSFLRHSIGTQDQHADHFGIRVMRDGEPVDLTGISVQGVFMPPQGSPIAITGDTYTMVEGNVAKVILPQACYNYEGSFTLAIKLIDITDSITGTIRIIDGVVDNTHASGTVAPTGSVPTYQEILSVYDDLVDALADVASYAANFAPEFVQGTANAAGSFVMNDGVLYLLPDGHTAGTTWANTTKTQANVGGQLSDLKSAINYREYSELLSIFKIEASLTLGSWTYNAGISRSGSNQAGNNMCRMNYMRFYRDYVFLLDSADYEYMIWCYTNESVGSADYSPTGKTYVTGATAVYMKNSTERMRISFRRVDGADLTNDPDDPTNDAYKIQHAMHFYRFTDTTLSTGNAAADAKAVGDGLSALSDRTTAIENASSVLYFVPSDVSETTSHGVTYSITDGVASFSGTADANVYLTISGGATTIPSWAEVGKSYYIEFKKNNQDDLRINVNLYNGQTYVRSLFSDERSGVFTIDSLENITGIIIRYALKKGNTADSTSTVRLLSAPTNMDLYNSGSSVAIDAPINFRIMQYNIGKFNNGQSISSNVEDDSYYRLFTTDNFDTILLNYKRLFGNVQPDIIGIEEYEKNLNVYVPNPEHPTKPTVVDHAVDMNTVLFDRLYPYKHDHTDSGGTPFTSKRAVKSKHDIILKSSKRLVYSYEWQGNTWTYGSPYNEEEHLDDKARQWMVMDKIDVGGKTVNVICSALPTYSGMDDPTRYPRDRLIAMRKGIIEAFIAELDEEDYAFIIGDMNSNGMGGMEGGETEGNSILNNALIPNGWNNVMGSYFPYEPTWQSINTGNYGTVDNIFYKDNGKVQMRNYVICTEEKPGLASDHFPVYADFLLL